MQIGDRVLYTKNNPINLNNDLGRVEDFDEDGYPVILFDDGFKNAINREDLSEVIDKAPMQSQLF